VGHVERASGTRGRHWDYIESAAGFLWHGARGPPGVFIGFMARLAPRPAAYGMVGWIHGDMEGYEGDMRGYRDAAGHSFV
jgi:hypothetical protein